VLVGSGLAVAVQFVGVRFVAGLVEAVLKVSGDAVGVPTRTVVVVSRFWCGLVGRPQT